MNEKLSDFWWLTLDETTKYRYVQLMHKELYSDRFDQTQPLEANTYNSLDTNGNLSKAVKCYPIEFIEKWKSKCANTNVFRSLSLFSAEHNGDELLGPFLMDIDRQHKSGKGYVMNLNEALEDTRRLTKEYLYKLKDSDFRIFFSGHKGFNIEVRPEALGIVSLNNRRKQFRDIRKDINNIFGAYFIDTIKEHIRLHDSINSWTAIDGNKMNRTRFELSLYELNNLDVDEICRRSERLALNHLSKNSQFKRGKAPLFLSPLFNIIPRLKFFDIFH